ncbi:MAG TPA: monofunctional biosynthetic peptidoglycan transglycosylase [Gemmatimonadota bacterium]|nr:monofunctional biosynthetic peptidoglycan transglycosylase [Gemmatimonadota bacterium]
MRAILRLAALLLLVPALYVGSAVAYFPAIVWHAFQPPHASALMRIRAAEAAAADRAWELEYRWVPLESVSPHLLRAVLAAEDTRFYEHSGFDVEQIQAAWAANRRSGRTLRGASTITQQTVKNLYLSPSRSVLRKAREAVLTAWMELWLPKDRILELYLNVVELGPGVFGAEAASRRYFGGSAAGLSRDQSALLAATLTAPLARNPASPTPGLRRRQRMIASRMSRWYEGPSVAELEAAGEIEVEEPPADAAPPAVLEAEPLDLATEPLPDAPPEDAAAASPPDSGEGVAPESPPPVANDDTQAVDAVETNP